MASRSVTNMFFLAVGACVFLATVSDAAEIAMQWLKGANINSVINPGDTVTFQWADGLPHSIQPVSQQGPPIFSGPGIDGPETAPFQVRLQFNGTGKYFFNDPSDPELTVGIITVQAPYGPSSTRPVINWEANTNYTDAVWNSTKGTGAGADPAPTPGPPATASPTATAAVGRLVNTSTSGNSTR